MDFAALIFGLFLGVFIFTLTDIINQTRRIWQTQHLASFYLWMIWTEAAVNFIFAIITFLYLNGVLKLNLNFLIATVLLWAIQTQLLSQIIANRISVIILSNKKSVIIKSCLFIIIGGVNISVGVIWISAHMPDASPGQLDFNGGYEKAEKTFFLVIDLALNLYFLYIVRFRLIAIGLEKYWALLKPNVAFICLSTLMDAALLGFLFFPQPYIYVQFAPLAYIVKLHNELSMAKLISKVARSGCREPIHLPSLGHPHTYYRANDERVQDSMGSVTNMTRQATTKGILRTTEMRVEVEQTGQAGNSVEVNNRPFQ